VASLVSPDVSSEAVSSVDESWVEMSSVDVSPSPSSSPPATTKAMPAISATASAARPTIRPVDGPDLAGRAGGTWPLPVIGS
jgi:hypothetical protein